jgi:hypothetical protein
MKMLFTVLLNIVVFIIVLPFLPFYLVYKIFEGAAKGIEARKNNR